MTSRRFADIIMPFALRGRFTYIVPDDLAGTVRPGIRVTVPFGARNLYHGIVAAVHDRQPDVKKLRSISAADDTLQINETQLKFWHWISEYYLCSEGEVMKAALPSEMSLTGYRPKLETFIVLARKFSDQELNVLLDGLSRAPRQQEVLSAYIRQTGYTEGSEIKAIEKKALMAASGSSSETIAGLTGKKILEAVTREVTRLGSPNGSGEPLRPLSVPQTVAYDAVSGWFRKKDIVLLHGVTSSGKTEIYIKLIEEQLGSGKQVLYMLPEIALTTQIILRLKKHFGEATGVYHSRFSDAEKVEIWKKVSEEDPRKGYRLILGVRSSLFLPFSNLGLIIVDEEHDGSYKQHDPAPRYHARDSAIMLASFHSARTILGSASPSVESYYNAVSGKYGLVELKERYGFIKLPGIVLANTREAYRKKLMVSHFTPELLEAMDEALGRNEQIILFQNRRGFSPYIECSDCGWKPVSDECAVNLTYHKGINSLVCHYCGYKIPVPHQCDNCHSGGLVTRGFGTEKIEDEIKIVFPEARVARMDQDSTGQEFLQQDYFSI